MHLALPPDHPLHLSTWFITLVGKILCYAIVAVAMDLIWGYGGILSLGHWDDVAAGPVAVITGLVSLALPLGFFLHWMGLGRWLALAIALLLLVAVAAMILRRPRPWGPRCARDAGLSAEIALVLGLVPLLTLFAAGVAMGSGLPAIAAAGIVPPNWLGDYAWAKPALIIMGLWAAIGSNNMILYLAVQGASLLQADLHLVLV